jgi:hypothetical protein
VIDLGQSADLDIEDVDALAELADALAGDGIEVRLAAVRAPALEVLRRGGLAGRVAIAPTLDAAVRGPGASQQPGSGSPERGPAVT